MKKNGLIIGLCLLLTVFVACNKENNGGGNEDNEQTIEGSLTGLFSVGNGKTVRFSQGNLQY